jgi:hypothetical protein
MSKPEEFKFDSRIRDRFLRSRVLSAAELQKHLDQLPDLEGEYDVLNDTPQPAVSPPRSEVHDEPLVFDGIRRLQALSEANNSAPAPRYVPPAPPSSALPSYREPESRPLGTPLRSALMESEISGVGAGAVSAALGAMAAEARGASVFGVPSSIPQTPAEEVIPPVTLRSESTGSAVAASEEAEEEVDEDDADEDDGDADEDDDDEDDADEDDADEDDADALEAAGPDDDAKGDGDSLDASDPEPDGEELA